MANMMSMLKQASSMKKEMKRIQKDLESKTVAYENGGVKVVARGDMTIVSIEISPDAVINNKPDRLDQLVTKAVNGALKEVKKVAAAQMQQMTGGLGGLGEMLGGL